MRVICSDESFRRVVTAAERFRAAGPQGTTSLMRARGPERGQQQLIPFAVGRGDDGLDVLERVHLAAEIAPPLIQPDHGQFTLQFAQFARCQSHPFPSLYHRSRVDHLYRLSKALANRK